MPPKAKFTREKIIDAAISVTKEQGISAVTAREVGKQLGTSSTPVFVAFENMEDLKQEVYQAIKYDFYNYICEGLNYTPAFKGFGFKMIEYARKFPKLFAVVHMNFSTDEINYDDMILNMAGAKECINAIKNQTGFDESGAKLMFKQVLITGFGVCYLISLGNCEFTESQLDEYLGIAYAGTIMAIKNKDKSSYKIHPEKR